MAKKEPSFEASLAELEEIVARMEEGEPELAELMENYSRGILLAEKCAQSLARAEKTMDLMVQKNATGGVEEMELKIEGD